MGADTGYARSGDVHIAYRAVGAGRLDLVLVPGFVSHVEHWWEHPRPARFMDRLSSFARLILFDKRGTGLSDPIAGAPALEQRMDDVRAVMEAVGSERAAILGLSEGGPMACLFAAAHPERVSALVVYGGLAKGTSDPEFPWAPYPEIMRQYAAAISYGWGEGVTAPIFAPSQAGDESFEKWWARYERLGASPGMIRSFVEMAMEIDIRDILPTIRVPTLVLHRTDDPVMDIGAGRYLADRIPDAKFVELPGRDHAAFAGDQDPILDEIEEFLTGVRRAPVPDRILATVMFTDIVASTERAVELGDRRWRALLDEHHALVRRQLEKFRGREVKTIGDGFLATFDGPGRGVDCARAIVRGAKSLGIEIRAGLHTGECEVIGDDVGGIAVHIGSRVASLAGAGEVLVSSTVKDLVVGCDFGFEDRGTPELKGVPGEWRLYAVQA